ncbi:MAG: hypothetical protein LUC51_10430, partial [Cloacibacillus porcorum]|nr:hypothetical protein [Cloacibacillus porcorum]
PALTAIMLAAAAAAYPHYANDVMTKYITFVDKLDKFYPLCYAMHNTLYIEDIEERGGSFDDHDAGD